MTAASAGKAANDLDPFWMPFTANRAFKAQPRLFASARDMHYFTPDGRAVLDGTAGLWCVNAGHARRPIVEAIQRQAEILDYAPTFQLGHPLAFELASRLGMLLPGDLNHVFFRFGVRGGRHRPEDRPRLSIGQGVREPHPPDRPPEGLSRRRLRRHFRRRAGEQQARLPHPARRRPPVAHAEPRRGRLHARPARLGPASGR